MTVAEFVELVRHKDRVIVYGAGLAGKIVQRFLTDREICVEAFATTICEEKMVVNGLPVYGLEDVVSKGEAPFIIVAVMKITQPDLLKNLEERNFTNYIVASEAIIYEMRNAVRAKEAEQARFDRLKAEPDNDLDKQSVGYLNPGYMDTNYAEHRLIIDKIEGMKYVKLPKELITVPCAGTEYENKIEEYIMRVEACYCPKEYIPEVSYIHTFNVICKTDLDWCVSFETLLPRLPHMDDNSHRDMLIECMKKPNCKAMFALCENAYRFQEKCLQSYLSQDDVELLMQKTHVLHAPQATLVSAEDVERRGRDLSRIDLIFIGRDFFTKGGKQLINVLSRMENKYNFKLTLISSMKYNDYFTKSSYEDMVKYKEIIMQKEWIDYYEFLPNEKVLELCKQAMVGLLPSIAETYGYVVLEMQAAGCPVITTNIRAFPELNNNECGWLCNIPVDENGMCNEHDMQKLSPILEKELERVFEDIFRHPEQIKEKGKLALQRIRDMHDPGRYAERIKDIMG